MSEIDKEASEVRKSDYYQHIDMGFINRRLCLSILSPKLREIYHAKSKPGGDHLSVLSNDHLLATIVLDVCDKANAPTLLMALTNGLPRQIFRSTESLEPCVDIYSAARVSHAARLSIDFGKPVVISYHTEHLVSSTGKMTLSEGANKGYVESIVGILHDRIDRFEIEPLIIGAPSLDHPRNDGPDILSWMGLEYGEVLPEDIDQFENMKDVHCTTTSEWQNVMKNLPEERVKIAFAELLREPFKKDWGGESNDHFSNNISLGGQRKTAAFLFKGPARFREMTLDMCGARADQIYRLVKSDADISIVQNSHLIGEAVRSTLRSMVVYPGRHRKYCLIDGQATYRILKAYKKI